jgi:DNA-binding FadR family transcriptional regulator
MKSEDSVQKRLEHLIITGVYTSGDRLPAERELARALSTSRNSVREAIARLTAVGMLTTLPQSGSYVADYRNQGSIDLFIHLYDIHGRFDDAIVRGLLDLRTRIESDAAAQAAELPDHEQIGEVLGTLTHRIEISEAEERITLDLNYHKTLISYSSNPVYGVMFTSMRKLCWNTADATYTSTAVRDELIWLQKRVNQALSEGNSLLSRRSVNQLLSSMTDNFLA